MDDELFINTLAVKVTEMQGVPTICFNTSGRDKMANILWTILWNPYYTFIGTHRKTFNTLRPRQDGSHFPDDLVKCIFFDENVWISIKISLRFVPKCPINNIPALIQIMAWRRPGDKPLSEPMMVKLPMHVCVTRPQWVKEYIYCI